MSEFWLYLKIGIGHILDSQAYDHVLFLIALTAAHALKNWKRVLFLVSVFAIGHMLSLSLATYEVIQVNKSAVEFLIPITIMVVAIYHISTAGKTLARNQIRVLLITTACFGLIHGLGFSGYFRMISSANSAKLFPLSIFALGIEIAQLIVVVVLLLFSTLFQTFFRFSKRDWVLVLSAIVVGLTIPMLIANKVW